MVLYAKKKLTAYENVANSSECCGSGCAAADLQGERTDPIGRCDVIESAASV